jgi:hypothetical protein
MQTRYRYNLQNAYVIVIVLIPYRYLKLGTFLHLGSISNGFKETFLEIL